MTMFFPLRRTRKWMPVLLAGLLFIGGAPHVLGAQGTVPISVFVRDDCGHCKDEKAFLATLTSELPQVETRYYNLEDSKNQALFNSVTSRYGLVKGTPLTLIKGQLITGFDTAETTGWTIRALVLHGTGNDVFFEDIADGGAEVIDSFGGACPEGVAVCESAPQTRVRIPLVGKTVDVGELSLSALALVLGLVDGFNPCALWVLIMFLLILAQVGSRKRMWQYAGFFIIAEAAMYYLILNFWFTVWDFVALDRIVTPLVGILALGSGMYFIYKFATFKPVCDVSSEEQQTKLAEKAKRLASKPLTIGIALGILGLAFSVNIFEFACSIGIPQTFTKILELNGIGLLGRQWYMLLYVIMYMIDDLFVFAIALYSFEKISTAEKYSKWAALVGGVLMIALGLMMLFRPELLIF